MEKIISEYINKLNGEVKACWLTTATECKEFGDNVGKAYSEGVAAGIDIALELLDKMTEEELKRMAANMEEKKDD